MFTLQVSAMFLLIYSTRMSCSGLLVLAIHLKRLYIHLIKRTPKSMGEKSMMMWFVTTITICTSKVVL
jgi:hypothetical protein